MSCFLSPTRPLGYETEPVLEKRVELNAHMSRLLRHGVRFRRTICGFGEATALTLGKTVSFRIIFT